MDMQPQEAAQWHQARRRRRRRGCAALLLTPVLVIVVLLGWFGLRLTSKPTISRDFIAELNAPLAGVPEEDRAWPLYKKAVLFKIEHPMPVELLSNRPIYPGWKQWDENKIWLDEIAPALDLVREGSRRPVMGKLLAATQDDDLARADAAKNGWDYVAQEPPENPTLIEVLLPELGYMRGFAQDLTSDSFYAMEEGDTARAIDNIESSLRMAEHAAASGTLIGQLVQIAMENLVSSTTLRLIDAYPGAFSAADLARLQNAFMTIGRDAMPPDGGLTRLSMDISLERAMFYDIVQRTYSDDGNGDGHMTVEGVKMMSTVSSLAASDSVLTAAAIPAVLFSASRRDLVSKYDDYMDRFEAYAAQWPWERDATANFDAEVERLTASPVSRSRYALISILLPALNRAATTIDQANTRRDATIAAIALHRWRLEHGSFPSTLEPLVPDALPRLPLDMVDGQPLRYVLAAEGPVLYSLGADKDDDGGVRGADERKVMAGQGAGEDGDWVLYPVLPPEEPIDE